MISHKQLLNLFNMQEDKFTFFISLSYEEKIFILENVHKKIKKTIISNLPDSEIVEIFERLDPDQVTDILQGLEGKKKSNVFLQLNRDLKEKVDFLLKFTPKSAAGIMNLNYIHININTPKKEIIARIEKHLNSGKREPTILVLDKNGYFVGELRISKLLFETKQENLFSNLKILPTIKYNENQEDCVHLFKRNRNEKVVVLDDDNYILGIIHARDIFKVIEEETTEDFYAISGVHKDEDVLDNAMDKVKFRFSWLAVNLVTAFLAAYVVSLFQDTISKIVIISAFMPLVAGMGGNAGAQTTAVLIRSIALKKVDSSFLKKILFNEITAGMINGFVLGIVVGTIAHLLNQNAMLGVVVGFAMFCNLIVASIFASIIPFVLKSFGFDPAVSSSIFVTTATDVLGFSVLLLLASFLLI